MAEHGDELFAEFGSFQLEACFGLRLDPRFKEAAFVGASIDGPEERQSRKEMTNHPLSRFSAVLAMVGIFGPVEVSRSSEM